MIQWNMEEWKTMEQWINNQLEIQPRILIATPKKIKFGKTQSKIVIGAWIFYQVSNNQELIKKRGHLQVVWMIA